MRELQISQLKENTRKLRIDKMGLKLEVLRMI
jgi:hypothetical protein